MADLEFKKRLIDACNNSPTIPDKNAGRLVFIAEKMKVSVEAVRKWFEGSKPRDDKIHRLARLLGVDTAWLSVGVNAEVTKAAQEHLNVTLTGAANVVIGLLTVNGTVCALPDDLDPRKEIVDFYAIINGKQMAFAVSVAEDIGDDTYRVKIRHGFESALNLVFVPGETLVDFIILKVNSDSIEAVKKAEGSNWIFTMTKTGKGYTVNKKLCQEVRSIEDF